MLISTRRVCARVEKPLEGELKGHKHRALDTHDRGHGRRDERHDSVAKVPSDFAAKGEWPWIKATGTAVRTTTHADGAPG